MGRKLYRIVQTSPPTETDFWSFRALGRQLRRGTPELQRLANGLSMFDTESQARAAATSARSFRLGHYIATLDIPPDSPIRIEKTLGPGHYTVWGEPAARLARVVTTAQVSGDWAIWGMRMGFTLWDTASGNALGHYEAEAGALALIRDVLADAGPALGADLMLIYENGRGHGHTVAEGDELVRRALAPSAIETLERIIQLVEQQRAHERPDLDAIEATARAGLRDAGRGRSA